MSKKTMPHLSSDKARKLIALLTILIFVAIITVVTVIIAQRFEEITNDPLFFREWIYSFGFWGRFVFIGIASIQVILAIIPGGPVQVVSGYAFGVIEGSLLCIIGIQLGSAIAFLLSRYLGTRVIELFFSKKKIDDLQFLQNSRRLDLIVFVCFLIPGAPKDLLTYFCGLTKLSFVKFMLITSVARLPSICVSVFSGNALIKENYPLVIGIFAAFIVLSGVGALIYRKMMLKEKKGDESSSAN